jgi:hypothetical protein
MKKQFLTFASIFFALSACTSYIEDETVNPEVKEYTISINVEDDNTKATVNDGAFNWSSNDKISVYGTNNQFNTLSLVSGAGTKEATFKGTIVSDVPVELNLCAVYPAGKHNVVYNEPVVEPSDPDEPVSIGLLTKSSTGTHTVSINLPSEYTLTEDNLSAVFSPMFATLEGDDVTFKHLCGLLALDFVNVPAAASKFQFVSTNKSIVGDFSFVLEETPVPELRAKTFSMAANTITFNLPSSSVARDMKLYVPLPTGEYNGMIVRFLDAEGNVLEELESYAINTITRKGLVKMPKMTFVTIEGGLTETVTLSGEEKANCYIISEPGIYQFDGTTIGNGPDGILMSDSEIEAFVADNGSYERSGYHVLKSQTQIDPKSAGIVWEESQGLIKNVKLLPNGLISFEASKLKGNALIAAYSGADCTGEILWSWHIWCTDAPEVVEVNNGEKTYLVMDRNIGATTAKPGSGSEGLHYQWGRKDPLRILTRPGMHQVIAKYADIRGSIQNPTKCLYPRANGDWTSSEISHDERWTPKGKTIYDPCPAGYSVAPADVFKALTFTGKKSYNTAEWNVENTDCFALGDNNYGYYMYTQPNKQGEKMWLPYSGYLLQTTNGYISPTHKDLHDVSGVLYRSGIHSSEVVSKSSPYVYVTTYEAASVNGRGEGDLCPMDDGSYENGNRNWSCHKAAGWSVRCIKQVK